MCTPSFKKFGFPSFGDQISGAEEIPRDLFRKHKASAIVDKVIQPQRDRVAAHRRKSTPTKTTTSTTSTRSSSTASSGKTSLHIRNR